MKKAIQDILKQYWGYDSFRSLQEEVILSVLEGKDTLALMPTGGGKSITYQVPALVLDGVCLVVTPLIALMKDQVEELQKRNISAEAIYTGMSSQHIGSVINKTVGGKVKFLYISPERLASPYFREHLRHFKITLLAVDEAHCISQWGYDFRPSYLRIAEIREKFPQVPVLALTATATPQVARDIQEHLKFRAFHVLSKSFRRENIAYVVRQSNDKAGELLHILSHLRASGIVYVRRRSRAEELAKFLQSNGIPSDFYHAGLSALLREEKQENWKNNIVRVIVATNAFGMGIDKPDVRVVIHFDIPDSPEAYFQEAGRAGRDGEKAYAVLLYNEASVMRLKKRIIQSFPEKKYVQEVYRLLGEFFHIGEGEGAGMSFEFDPQAFVQAYRLEMAQALSAIRVLQVAGYLECTTEMRARSRLCFLVLRDQLDHISLESPLSEQLVVFILRHYPGVFTQHIHIDEDFLASRLGVNRNAVYHELILLAKRKILSYIPGNDRPYMVYLQPRVPASYVHIGRTAYEDRKKAYVEKVKTMIGYITSRECRQLYLMRYFGQKEKKACGICDFCIEEKKKKIPGDTKVLEEKILRLLEEKEMVPGELIANFQEQRKEALACLHLLLDRGVVYYKNLTTLAVKEGKR